MLAQGLASLDQETSRVCDKRTVGLNVLMHLLQLVLVFLDSKSRDHPNDLSQKVNNGAHVKELCP